MGSPLRLVYGVKKRTLQRDVQAVLEREVISFSAQYLKSDHHHSHADEVKISRVRNQFYSLSLCLLFVPDKPN